MLKKLITYEFRATHRFMLLLYGVLIVLSAMMALSIKGRWFDRFKASEDMLHPGETLLFVLAFFVISLFIVMLVVVSSATFFYGIKRFHDNVLGNEGYLMHTLPVKTRDLLLSKTIVCTLWTLASAVLVLLSYFCIILSINSQTAIQVFKREFYYLCRETGAFHMFLFCIEGSLAACIACFQNYLHIYAAMSMGYARNTKRAFFSVVYYILLHLAVSFVTNFVGMPIYMILENETGAILTHLLFLCYILFAAAISRVFYAIAHHHLQNKLNLQ